MPEKVSSRVGRPGVRRVLAQKYRPQKLNDLIGQDLLVQSLTQGILDQHIAQAILLHGIRGTGKTSTARILARSLNCSGLDGQGPMTIHPCGLCPSCKALNEDRHPDIIEIDAASHTGVDDIREVIESAQYKAIVGRFKIFIIDEVHMLSKSAFNALLKTLEEPPQHVLFIFATTEINKIPETILSRCARFDLKRIDSKILMQHFDSIAHQEGYEIEKDALAILARAAEGSVRDGLTILDQAMSLTEAENSHTIKSSTLQSMIGITDRQLLYPILEHILRREMEFVLKNVRKMLENGADALMIVQDLLECLYRAACFKMVPRLVIDEAIPEFERTASAAIAEKIEAPQLLSLWKMMLKGYEDVKRAPLTEQALEMVLLRIGWAAQLPPIETLLKQSGALSSPQTIQDGTPIEPETTSKNPVLEDPTVSKVVIQSIEDLFKNLENDREALLLSYLQKDIAFISLSPGQLILQLRKEEAAKVLPTLKQFLYKKTGLRWNILQDKTNQQAQTQNEKVEEGKKKKEEEVLKSSFAQDMQENFPGVTLEII